MGIVAKLLSWVKRGALLVSPIIAGLAGATAGAQGGVTWDEATSTDTVESYTAFILGELDREWVDEAFCRLQDIDQNAARGVVADIQSRDEQYGVGLNTCATSGSARLFTI